MKPDENKNGLFSHYFCKNMGVCRFTIKIGMTSLFSNRFMGNGAILTFDYHIYEQMFNPPWFLRIWKKSVIHKKGPMYWGFSFY